MNFEENKNFIESIPILANIDNTQKIYYVVIYIKKVLRKEHTL